MDGASIVHPAFTINWLLHDVPLMITCTECLILGCYYQTLSSSLCTWAT